MPGTAEDYWRGLLRGPLTVQPTSKSNEFAGKYNIASGAATVTISTTTVTSDSIVWLGVQGSALVQQNSIPAANCWVSSISDRNFFIASFNPPAVGTDF